MTSDTPAIASEFPPRSPQPFWQRLVSFPALIAVLLVGAIFIPLRNFGVDPDLWWHIKVGATILSTHHFPTFDIYSCTAFHSPWIAYEWLGELLVAAVNNAGGLRGLLALDLGLTIAILFSLYALATKRSGNSKAAGVACVVVLPLVYVSLTLRPQMLGYVFLILTLIILDSFRNGHTWSLWFLPPMFLLWVNIHGSFVLGLFALGVYWASGLFKIQCGNLESHLWTASERIRLELAALLILLCLMVTPYGTEACLYPLDMAFSQPINVSNIQEWQSLAFNGLYGKVFLALVLAFLVIQITVRPAWRLEDLLLAMTGIAGSCIHTRFLLAFVPFFTPLLAMMLSRAFPPYDHAKDKYALNAIMIALVIGAIIWYFPSRKEMNDILTDHWPVRAIVYAREHNVPKPMLNNYGYGGYLIYAMSDANKVFVDGRGDLYERSGVLSDYLTIMRLGPGAPVLLDSYNVQSCMIGQDEPLRTYLAASPNWQKVYGDPLTVIYVRRPRGMVSVGVPVETGPEPMGTTVSERQR